MKKNKSLLLIFIWLIWITISLLLVRDFIYNINYYTASFIVLNVFNKILITYLVSIPITTLMVCGGSWTYLKENYLKVITANLLVAFFFYAFYQYLWAFHGAANISYENIYEFKEMTAAEYNLFYATYVKTYYFASLSRTLFVGLLLAIPYLLIKNQKNSV